MGGLMDEGVDLKLPLQIKGEKMKVKISELT